MAAKQRNNCRAATVLTPAPRAAAAQGERPVPIGRLNVGADALVGPASRMREMGEMCTARWLHPRKGPRLTVRVHPCHKQHALELASTARARAHALTRSRRRACFLHRRRLRCMRQRALRHADTHTLQMRTRTSTQQHRCCKLRAAYAGRPAVGRGMHTDAQQLLAGAGRAGR